jgi:PAS domain S-box-containing protein
MEYLNAYILCFLQVSFSALILILLHGLRRQIGMSPFYLALATLLVFAHFINSADLQLSTGASGLSINVATSLLLSPFIMAMLIVYAIDGTIAAQRLTIGAVAVSGTFFYLANITASQCDWYGFELASKQSAEILSQLLTRSNEDVAAALGAIIIDLLVLPVAFQFFKNRKFSIFFSVTLSLLFTQVADSFIYSLIANAWAENFWENMRQLYLSRAITMIWLGILTTIYLKMNNYEVEHKSHKNPLDFVKAIVNSYTRKRLIQSHLHEWEGRFELFVENSQDLILLVGRDGCIYDGNKIAVQYIGMEIEELQKSYISDLTIDRVEEAPDYLKQVVKEYKSWDRIWQKLVNAEGENIQHEWALRDYKERVISLEFSITLIEIGDHFALLTGRNSSARHKLSHERQGLMHQLSHSQRLESVGRLAGGIAHDFNNLLHSIQGSMDSISKNPSAEKQKALENNIVNAVTKASTLTGQLLGFAQKGKYAVKKVDLCAIMQSCYSLFEPMARKSVKCRLIIHPEPIYAKADATQIEQVLLNLLINSRDALDDCEKPKIFFRLEHASDYTPGWHLAAYDVKPEHFACIRCKDNGSGIKPENLKTIFDPFFTTKEVGKGTGMGLAMAYGTINNHNGWIHVESEVGKGTEFFIFLPLFNTYIDTKVTHTQLNIII